MLPSFPTPGPYRQLTCGGGVCCCARALVETRNTTNRTPRNCFMDQTFLLHCPPDCAFAQTTIQTGNSTCARREVKYVKRAVDMRRTGPTPLGAATGNRRFAGAHWVSEGSPWPRKPFGQRTTGSATGTSGPRLSVRVGPGASEHPRQLAFSHAPQLRRLSPAVGPRRSGSPPRQWLRPRRLPHGWARAGRPRC